MLNPTLDLVTWCLVRDFCQPKYWGLLPWSPVLVSSRLKALSLEVELPGEESLEAKSLENQSPV